MAENLIIFIKTFLLGFSILIAYDFLLIYSQAEKFLVKKKSASEILSDYNCAIDEFYYFRNMKLKQLFDNIDPFASEAAAARWVETQAQIFVDSPEFVKAWKKIASTRADLVLSGNNNSDVIFNTKKIAADEALNTVTNSCVFLNENGYYEFIVERSAADMPFDFVNYGNLWDNFFFAAPLWCYFLFFFFCLFFSPRFRAVAFNLLWTVIVGAARWVRRLLVGKKNVQMVADDKGLDNDF